MNKDQLAAHLEQLPEAERWRQIRAHLWLDQDWEEVTVHLAARLSAPSQLVQALLDEPHDVFLHLSDPASRCVAAAHPERFAPELLEALVGRLVPVFRSPRALDREAKSPLGVR